ncbi:MAG: NUDIX hydrolase, partial [Patescibacteria group bacterium]
MKKLLPYEVWFSTLPKKVAGSGGLIFNRRGEVLILKTTYRDGWIIPGGIVEEGESPIETCLREVQEEIGIKIKLGKLICLDYKVRTDKNFYD